MRQILWILCGLAAAVPAYAAETDGCRTNRDLMLQEAAQYDCPAEEAEARAITCTSSGLPYLEETKRLAELLQTCQTRPKKELVAATEPTGVPTPKHQCRGVDKDGAVIEQKASDRTAVDCLSDLKQAVSAKLCDGSAPDVEFTYQTFPLEKWSKGTSVKARCKK